MAKRGLFQSIFGGKSEKNKDFHAYKLELVGVYFRTVFREYVGY